MKNEKKKNVGLWRACSNGKKRKKIEHACEMFRRNIRS